MAIFKPGEDACITVRVRRVHTGDPVNNLSVQVISFKDPNGNELLEEPEFMTYNDQLGIYQGFVKIPDNAASGIYKFKVIVEGQKKTIEEGIIQVK
jgi:uncharacterized protein YfaS (alpha-2-macroglobulin family)